MSASDRERKGPFDLSLGTKGKGWINVAQSPGGNRIGFPWLAIRGAKDGPVLTTNCGLHGDEYDGGEAMRLLFRELDPDQLAGTWIAIPVMNLAAFEAAHRISPVDFKNMNRIFPDGLDEGSPSPSGLVAKHYYYSIVKKSNAVLDFHAAGNPFSLLPCVCFDSGTSKESKKSRELGLQTGLEYLWEFPHALSGNVCCSATSEGIPTVTPEIGNSEPFDPALVARAKQVITNVMIAMGMVKGDPVLPKKQYIFRGTHVPCHQGGVFHSCAAIGEVVKKGQVVGTVQDVFGDVLEEICAPTDGVVISFRVIPAIFPGQLTTLVGEIVEAVEGNS